MFSAFSRVPRRLVMTGSAVTLLGLSWAWHLGVFGKLWRQGTMQHSYDLSGAARWDPHLMSLHLGADVLLAISYVAIAVVLAMLYVRERRRAAFAAIFAAFGIFLAASGLNYGMDAAVLLGWPMFWLVGAVKFLAALGAVTTAIVLPEYVPLTHRLIRDALSARKNERRFLAASDSNHDCFFILESVRDTQGKIVDFRFVFVNKNGATLLSTTPPQIVGKLLCESYTVNRTHGFFERYKRVVETGESFRQEFPIHAEKVNASWLSHYVVKLEDGVAITTTDISAVKENEQRLTYMAKHDALTGLASRSLFEERLAEALAEARQTSTAVGLMVVDCDHFKRVNDLLGHQAGDALLVQVAGRLKASVDGRDTVARVGGDEFMVVLRSVRDEQEAEVVAQRVLAALQEPLTVEGRTVSISASIGLSVSTPEPVESAMGPVCIHWQETLLRNADAAMYQAKSEGRSRVQVFTREMASSLARRRLLEQAMQQALAQNEFELVYQPRVDLRSGVVSGVEALLRWHSGRLGMVMPAEFIPIAEENGQIVPIGRWVLEQACREMHQLEATMGKPMQVAVNVSPRQFQQQTLAADVAGSMQRHQIAADALELEITENLLLQESPQSRANFEGVRALGVTIAIDDFGTGYSSMSYLTRFHVDRLKIDQSFIGRLEQDAESNAICKAIVGLAKALNIDVVAEGVDSGRQCDLLRGLGCDEAQGHWYARPVSLFELPAVLRSIEFGAMRTATIAAA